MDLLGTIMSSMEKPPSLSEQEKLVHKKRKQELEMRQETERKRFTQFKNQVEEKISSHFNNSSNKDLKFAPMDHVHRSIIHECAENLGFLTYAFGIDGVDRYVRVYRKEYPPCEDELANRRRGEPWNEKIKETLNKKREEEKSQMLKSDSKKRSSFVPNTNYQDKYVHIIGNNSVLEVAQKTEINKSYGFVPSENKRDVRSIEQTMADLRAKKMKKNQSFPEK